MPAVLLEVVLKTLLSFNSLIWAICTGCQTTSKGKKAKIVNILVFHLLETTRVFLHFTVSSR